MLTRAHMCIIVAMAWSFFRVSWKRFRCFDEIGAAESASPIKSAGSDPCTPFSMKGGKVERFA
jgi:hypothetical protein